MKSNVQEKFEKNKVHITYEDNFEYIISVARYLLKMVAAWPLDDNVSTSERIYKYCMNVFLFALIIFFFAPSVLYAIFKTKSTRVKIRIISMILMNFANVIKYIFLLMHNKEIKICLYETKEDWKNIILRQDYENMLSRGKLGRSLVILSTCLIYGASLFNRVIIPLTKGNIIVNNVTIRRLPLPSYYIFFDVQKSPVYEFIYFAQIFTGFVVLIIASTVFALTTYFIMHICGQIDILIREIQDIETANSDIGNADNLIHLTILHQIKSKSFLKKVTEIVQYMCLAEIFFCMLSICVVFYALNRDYTYSIISIIGYSIIIISFTFNLFIFCYIGELLDTQNMKVITISRTLGWHNLLLKSVKNLIIVILVANDLQKLVPGKFVPLTLSNFTTMFKTAIGYFNFLRNTTS
ncbi:odorant receptor 43a-like [Vespa velutina]|uniref:odorant receptor 43a-like n=1 Tax=Vespa velutina TaxID=202808 RepID=UPI001FB2037C|nr:odorant receptor 43a-like [Vespa velutina]